MVFSTFTRALTQSWKLHLTLLVIWKKASSPTDLPQTTLNSENENFYSFNFFDKEFQVELALAISVSDQGRKESDPETTQINAAKQISLRGSPSQSLSEFLSQRYWSNSVVNYDEKVIDGFYFWNKFKFGAPRTNAVNV
ncbi:unnamed protein product [Fraxinus pennsylvanica]|uniref:EDR1/CTR1/ARMC3-like peptidase-like domain-containing protein n=1 Tax=Fraxinus pennsylvanica TaxID=56036 RepID=A0AAD2E3V3_9LAMI|nr:unnamed protein product [Fraxinus pennsylvanica]